MDLDFLLEFCNGGNYKLEISHTDCRKEWMVQNEGGNNDLENG
jgi:hypothetical protein